MGSFIVSGAGRYQHNFAQLSTPLVEDISSPRLFHHYNYNLFCELLHLINHFVSILSDYFCLVAELSYFKNLLEFVLVVLGYNLQKVVTKIFQCFPVWIFLSCYLLRVN